MNTEWTWPAGKTFGQLTADEKRMAAQRAGAQLEAELTANVDAISRIMNEAGTTYAECEHTPPCLLADGADTPCGASLDGGVDLCHICGDEADGECAICERPVCDDDAVRHDHDRFCVSCAPPGGA